MGSFGIQWSWSIIRYHGYQCQDIVIVIIKENILIDIYFQSITTKENNNHKLISVQNLSTSL
jgi:hypothetical protein